MIVYLLTSPENKCYVGQTRSTMLTRFKQHVKRARKGDNYPLYNAFRKYGAGSFSSQVLSVAKTEDELDNLEKIWITLLRTQEREFGYNLLAGGSYGKHAEETKQRMSAKHSGKNNPFFGKKHSEEHKKYIAEISRVNATNISEETRQKRRISLSGNKNPMFGKVPWNKKATLPVI